MQGERGGFTRGGGQNNMMQTPQDRYGNGDPAEARKGGKKMCRQRRQAEVGRNPWTGEPLAVTGTWAQVEGFRGGSNRRVMSVTGLIE